LLLRNLLNLETSKTPVDPPRTFVEEKAVAPVSSGKVNLRHLLIAIVVVAACAELSYTTVNMSAMAVYIQYGIKIDLRWIAICSISFIAMEGLLKTPMGILGDRYGRKTLMVIGPFVSVITALLTPHVSNPYILVFLRILDGIGAAALWPAAFSLIGDHVPENKRAGAMSLFNLAYLIGLGLGPILGGGINDFTYYYLHTTFAHSKEASFYLASVLFAVTTVVAFVMIPNFPPTAPQRTSAASDDGHTGEHGFNIKQFLQMLGRMPMTLLMTFITFLGIGLVMSYFKVFTLEHFHLSESKFGLMMIGPVIVVGCLAVPMGLLGDKIGKARAVQIGIGICSFSFWLLILLSQKWTVMMLGALLGIGFAIAFPAWMALITTECDAKQRGAVVGAVGTAQGLGAVVGVVCSSFLYRYGAFNLAGFQVPKHGAPFLACAVMLTISFVLGIFTLRDNPHYIRTHDTPP
jgi:DHA1 family multidrug resistance protein-like MFS transporter